PLASGFLTGKYEPDAPPPPGTRLGAAGPMGARMAQRTLTEGNFATLQRLRRFAEDRGHTVLDLAFAWLAAQPTVSSVIAGATKPEQVEQNVRAAGWTLTAEEMKAVDGISGGMSSR
ncbi:MAG: aldo/keto reductase, partial [Alphaproteobacteria bacterium]|nr:aldo/keto reductase [Alphaproteobacteria bacterium]